MLQSEFVRIIEEVPVVQPQQFKKKFQFICYRACRGARQEMIVVRLPVQMAAGKELWQLIKETRDELQQKFNLDSCSTLGAIDNCLWMSVASIVNDRGCVVEIARG
jgi:hypothetical protein